MIFVDTNVFMYAVGRPHPLRKQARAFFERAADDRAPLCTSAEVMQELLHAYLPVGRTDRLDDALSLIARSCVQVWVLEPEDLTLAAQLRTRFPALGARDLCHLAVCQRRAATAVKTFDRAFATAGEQAL